ncbi:lipoprotein releasing system transmembrane protein [Actinobacillus equuli]|nr:lipoprotein releasing system transmembrane protein [Actinobacillus equuli]
MNLTTLFIAFRYWRSKSADRFGRLVTNLASFGIVLGVMALVIVLSVMNGLENMQKRNLLSTLPHAIVLPQEGHFDKNQSINLPAFASKSVAINKANVIIQSQQGINAGQLLGVENENDDPMLIGEDVKALLPQGEFNVLIGSRLANKLNIGTGEKIRLMITETVNIRRWDVYRFSVYLTWLGFITATMKRANIPFLPTLPTLVVYCG